MSDDDEQYFVAWVAVTALAIAIAVFLIWSLIQ
jgi:hypothetical protein